MIFFDKKYVLFFVFVFTSLCVRPSEKTSDSFLDELKKTIRDAYEECDKLFKENKELLKKLETEKQEYTVKLNTLTVENVKIKSEFCECEKKIKDCQNKVTLLCRDKDSFVEKLKEIEKNSIFWKRTILWTGITVVAAATIAVVIAWHYSGMSIERLKNAYAVLRGKNPFPSPIVFPVQEPVVLPTMQQPIVEKKTLWELVTCPDCRHF